MNYLIRIVKLWNDQSLTPNFVLTTRATIIKGCFLLKVVELCLKSLERHYWILFEKSRKIPYAGNQQTKGKHWYEMTWT